MKIATTKFALALGAALSFSFLICNIIFTIGGKDFSADIINTIFHNMDLKPLLIDNDFSIMKLIYGMIILLLEGFFIGFVTIYLYNSFNNKSSKSPNAKAK